MEHGLLLRPIGENDYTVMREGRVRLSVETHGRETWHYNITVPLPMPSFGSGDAPSLEAAKDAFRAAWVQFYDRLRPRDIEHWHRHQDGVRERTEWLR